MKRIHKLTLIYTEGCPPCKVRQLRYGYRLDDFDKTQMQKRILNDLRFTHEESEWICRQVGLR